MNLSSLVVSRNVRHLLDANVTPKCLKQPGDIGAAYSRARMSPSKKVRLGTVAKGSNTEVRICTNKACRRSGSRAVLACFRELTNPEEVAVIQCGCLGQCGAGPNIVFLPSELVVRHCSTPAQVARLVELQCLGGDEADNALKLRQMRLEAESLSEKGEFQQALDMFTTALSVPCKINKSALYSSRSMANLALGSEQQALADAQKAVELDGGSHKAQLHQARALEALNLPQEALDACHAALDLKISLTKDEDFLLMLRRLRDKISTAEAQRTRL
ncbi:hypothetical protein CYMTET_4039 [Cymbomonas tetramitiformis]|uniref:Uncharacterized protein n=1 Tax=Cymbomonas tetramitiformis TaxID=36881 RepID=A0AAE0H227_9CHLO|nr:hypothetical protein CYMTET_4039 [Cymbomonas tetramitiformis]